MGYIQAAKCKKDRVADFFGRLYFAGKVYICSTEDIIMTTIVPHSELLRRAAAFVAERFAEECPDCAATQGRPPEKALMAILDEAGMRFNLSPSETRALCDLFHKKD